MRRQYSDEQKAEALLVLESTGGNVGEAVRKSGIPRTTLRHWVNGRGVHPVAAEMGLQKRAPLADRLEELAHQLIDLMPEAAAQAPANHLAVSLGIAIDKMRLLRDQPTSIDEHNVCFTDEERADRALALLDAARARRAGQPAPDATIH